MRRFYGYVLIALGIGILITMLIPEEFWACIVATLSIATGIFLVGCY